MKKSIILVIVTFVVTLTVALLLIEIGKSAGENNRSHAASAWVQRGHGGGGHK